jgi:4-amino-4-deoxy-L-arabinose transferase-like glycosyltransferase
VSLRRLRADHAVALGLGVAAIAVLLATVRGVGFTRDEGYYFRAADLYLQWLLGLFRGGDSLSDAAILRSWSYNAEHPALMKTLFGLSWKLFHDQLGWVSHSTGYRLPAIVFAGGMIALVHLFAAEACSRRVALVAAGLLATIPRLFHDAHLACFDVPVAAMQLLVVYAYWRSLRSARWAVLTGLFFGLALATKLNAFFIPLFLAVHAGARAFRGQKRVDDSRPPVPLVFLAMATLGPLVFLAHWPYLWHHPIDRLGGYLAFHLHHEHYPVGYFETVLEQPPFPWGFVFVMTAVTVPLVTVTLMAIAVLRGLVSEVALLAGSAPADDEEAGDPRLTRLLLLLAGLTPMLVMTLPGVPIFGGVKHWFTSLPFLCILAAAELDRLLAWAGWPRQLAYAAIALAAVLPGALGIRLVHPYGIGFYNELIGSVRGAADRGMLRNFWGYTSRGNLAYLDAHVEAGGRVFFQRTNVECYEMDQRDGLLRRDIRYAWRADEADWATIHFDEPTFADDEYRIWNDWGATRPAAGVYVDEVPMNLVYRRADGQAANPP